MGALSRDAILQASDIRTKLVHVPEWGGSVLVRGLTGRERDAFELAVTDMKTGGPKVGASVRARLVVLGAVEENGTRLFSDDDVAALGKKSAAALERVFDEIRHLSGMTDEDLAELEGNSDSQGDVSPSA